jgi:putative restriction endonuclease
VRTEAEQRSIREDVFRWLDERLAAGSYELSRAELESYSYLGERIPLLDRSRGIRNPGDFDSTLSIMTGAKGGGRDAGPPGAAARHPVADRGAGAGSGRP